MTDHNDAADDDNAHFGERDTRLPPLRASIAGPQRPLFDFLWGKAVPLFEGDVGIFLEEEVFADRGRPHTPCVPPLGEVVAKPAEGCAHRLWMRWRHILQMFNAIRG